MRLRCQLILAALLLTACATPVATKDADLASLDACAPQRDAAHESLRATVAKG